jgi:hypothetical protein
MTRITLRRLLAVLVLTAVTAALAEGGTGIGGGGWVVKPSGTSAAAPN